ncbi:MAG: hypothetical protein K2H37_07745 [Lachnospiraceae bacterium]|nr:hypothetical protein [Lachnospiraceae bacterium]
MTEKKVTPEKRMELARHIREENLGNRLKLRQREHILYGKESPVPLYEKGLLAEAEGFPGYGNGEHGEGIPGNAMGGFKYRMVLSVLLFVGFLLCDTRDSKILSYSTGDVYDMIVADSFHLYDGGENAVMEELTNLFQ